MPRAWDISVLIIFLTLRFKLEDEDERHGWRGQGSATIGTGGTTQQGNSAGILAVMPSSHSSLIATPANLTSVFHHLTGGRISQSTRCLIGAATVS